jgi:hypothetical protein
VGEPGQPQTTSDSPGLSKADRQPRAPIGGAVVLSGVDVTGAPSLLSGLSDGEAA